MDFLDKSQTFFGVLLALVALMLYKHDGNLFFQLLKNINEDITKEINALSGFSTLASIKENIRYQRIVKAAQKKGGKTASSCSYIISLVNIRINNGFVRFQPQTYIDHCQKLMEWREIFVAPFYTFIFCILIFVVDEILRYFTGIEMLTLGSIFWFILISSIFWLVIWSSYIHDAWIIQKYIEKEPYTDEHPRERVGWYLVIVVLLTLLYIIGMWHHVSRYFTQSVILFICTIEIFKGILAVWTLFKQNCHVGQLGYRFTMKHFVYVVVVSLLLSILLSSFHKPDFVYPDYLFNNRLEVIGIRCAVFCFVIINGLFLPFVFPLIFLWRMKKLASKEAERIRKFNKQTQEDIIKLIDEKIKKYHLNF